MSDLREYMARREERRQALIDAGATRESLLEELRQTLRGIRESLPIYRRVQEPARYAMTAEDIEDHEQRYAQLKNDQAGIHDDDDYIDALLNAQDTSQVIVHVLENYGRGANKPLAQRQFSTWWLLGGLVVIVLLMRACGV